MKKGREKMSFVAEKNKTEMKSKKEIKLYNVILFNSKWCLKKANLDAGQKKKVALSLAVFTAPYLFYLPTKWFF